MTSFKSVTYIPKGKSVPVTIEYSDEGSGNVIVMLPSLARSGRDFDDVTTSERFFPLVQCELSSALLHDRAG